MCAMHNDRTILRRLAARVAEIAAEPCHHHTVDLWTRLNGLQVTRPLVWIDEIPWHEMDVSGALTLRCEDPFCREHERRLRRLLYQWEHLRGDMVVEPVYYAPLVIRDSGFGIRAVADVIPQDAAGGIASHGYHPQIRCEQDISKIRTPEISLNEYETEHIRARLVNLFGDLLPVEPRGIVTSWFAPWDQLVEWWGVQEAMVDLVDRPELIHAAIERLVTAHLSRLEQWEALGALTLAPGNYRVGSGGLGYTDELPQPDCDPRHVRPADQWGFATAQIFASVSPEMHAEFALRYERRWLERFGLTYYGCCEPLEEKLDVLRQIPNLRKLSVSPWANVARIAELTRGRYVLSIKPNPALLAADTWNPERAHRELQEALTRARGCPVEIILKDISTVRRQPYRLWAWAGVAMEVAEAFAP